MLIAMGRTPSAALPVHMLHEHVVALKEAIKLCLEEPDPKPVHRLRTMTRRVEGQLALFAAIPQPPRLKHEGQLRRTLKRLRRAAGEVRDLDVQIALLEDIGHGKTDTALGRDSAKMHRVFKGERDEAASKLTGMLRRREKSIVSRLDGLMKDLEQHKDLTLEPRRLSQLAREWFASHVSTESGDTEDAEQLHSIRKTAKLARYIAENAPRGGNSAKRLANQFEAVQEAGGQWHDWLILAQIAASQVGRSSPLTATMDRRCRSRLTAYRRTLRSTLSQISETPLRLTVRSSAEAVPRRRARSLRRK